MIQSAQPLANDVKNTINREGGTVHRASVCETCEKKIEDPTKIIEMNGKRICKLCFALESVLQKTTDLANHVVNNPPPLPPVNPPQQ